MHPCAKQMVSLFAVSYQPLTYPQASVWNHGGRTTRTRLHLWNFNMQAAYPS